MVGSTYLSFTELFHLIKFLGLHHGLSGPLAKLCAQYKHSQYIIKLSIFPQKILLDPRFLSTEKPKMVYVDGLDWLAISNTCYMLY